MIKVGITGGIGSGKTLVTKIFANLDVPIYYADERARWLMEHDPGLVASIKQQFGDESYTNGNLNRVYLAEQVFKDKSNTEKMNALVHPSVGEDFSSWCAQQQTAYVMKEAALLFEAGSYKLLDKIICVSASEDIRIQRVLKRDPHRTELDIKRIMDKQLPEQEKINRSDFVIINDGSELVIPQVLKIHQTLTSLQNH